MSFAFDGRGLAEGATNRAIAGTLVVDTVKRQVTDIFERLGAVNRTEAVALARDLGLLP